MKEQVGANPIGVHREPVTAAPIVERIEVEGEQVIAENILTLPQNLCGNPVRILVRELRAYVEGVVCVEEEDRVYSVGSAYSTGVI